MDDEIEYFLKLVVVGDKNAGKTALITTFIEGGFNRDELPPMAGSYCGPLRDEDESRMYNIDIWDTNAGDEVERLRAISYAHTRVFLVCFAIDEQDSFDRVEKKWLPEIRKSCPTAPFILVGTKSDIRNRYSIPPNDASLMADRVGADKYVECSALHNENVQELFIHASRISNASMNGDKSSKICTLL